MENNAKKKKKKKERPASRTGPQKGYKNGGRGTGIGRWEGYGNTRSPGILDPLKDGKGFGTQEVKGGSEGTMDRLKVSF